jgi:Fe-S oxidoreductase
LRARKWQNLDATGASILAMGNPGCALHLQPRAHEAARRKNAPVIAHPVVLLARAYADEKKAPQ